MNLSARTYVPSHKHTSTSPLQNKFLRKDSLNSPNKKLLTMTQSSLKKTKFTPNRVEFSFITFLFQIQTQQTSRDIRSLPKYRESDKDQSPIPKNQNYYNKQENEHAIDSSRKTVKTDIVFKDLYKQLSSMSISSNQQPTTAGSISMKNSASNYVKKEDYLSLLNEYNRVINENQNYIQKVKKLESENQYLFNQLSSCQNCIKKLNNEGNSGNSGQNYSQLLKELNKTFEEHVENCQQQICENQYHRISLQQQQSKIKLNAVQRAVNLADNLPTTQF